MSSMKIRGDKYTIDKVFSDEFAFEIPHYQRPYAWMEEHAGELLSDLLTSMGDDDTMALDEMPDYFLGCIVLIKTEDEPDAKVVDGQQRLTTLTILLSALRETIGGTDAEDLTQFLYAKGNKMLGTENRYRLMARERDRDFFRKYVQEAGGLAALAKLDPARLPNDSQVNMRTNGALYLRELKKLVDLRRLRLAQFILTRCVLVAVSSENQDSAYRIFSILNDRGLDLSHADILKADIIGKMSPALQEAYAAKWETVEDDLGRDAFQDLFAHIRMIYRRTKLRETVLKEFRENVIPLHPPRDLIDKILVPFAESYLDIRDQSYESTTKAEEVNGLLAWLNRIDNVDWVPPAIKFITDHRDSPADIVTFLADLERLAAAMMIMRTNITKRIERYGKLLKAMADGDDLSAAASPLQLSDVEKKEVVAALDGPIYSLSLTRVPLFVLLRLDSALSTGTAKYAYSTISIEHVLPQNPKADSKWVKDFPDAADRDKTVHRIGNLVLLARRKNSEARNFEFDTKKGKYFAEKTGISSFVLTTQVIKEKEWTPAVVSRRQQVCVDKLRSVWRL
jgi:hypothetical protein